MNPAITRQVKSGKHQQRIIDISHELFLYQIDVLDQNTARDILEREDDADALKVFLQTTEPLKNMYSDYQYNIALERSERIAQGLAKYMRAFRRSKTAAKQTLQSEYKKEKIKELEKFSKKFLARKLVELLPKKDVEKIIHVKIEKDQLKKADPSQSNASQIE